MQVCSGTAAPMLPLRKVSCKHEASTRVLTGTYCRQPAAYIAPAEGDNERPRMPSAVVIECKVAKAAVDLHATTHGTLDG